MSTKQISVFLENIPGALGDFCTVLETKGINMRAMCLAESLDFGLLRFVTDDADSTAEVLKEEGFVCAISEVIAVAVEDKAGSLMKVLSTMAAAGINLDYSYAFTAKEAEKAYFIMKVSDIAAAEKALSDAGITVYAKGEFHKLFK